MSSQADVWSELRTLREPEQFVQVLQALDHHAKETRWQLVRSVLEALKDTGSPEFEAQALRLSVTRPQEEAHSARAVLLPWLREQQAGKRTEVLQYLKQELEGREGWGHVEGAILTVAAIGYRDDAIVRSLEALLETNRGDIVPEPVQDAALWALTVLGYEQESRLKEWVAAYLRSRPRPSTALLSVARRLRSATLAPLLLDVFQKHAEDEEIVPVLLRALADTAEAHPEIAYELWEPIAASQSSAVRFMIALGGDILQKFDCPHVGDYLLAQIKPSETAPPDDESWRSSNFYTYLRVRELDLPRPLAGMRTSLLRHSEPVLRGLQMDACIDTRNQTKWTTGRSLLKEATWEVVLRLNPPAIREWLVEALEDTNLFMASKLCKIVGLLRTEAGVPRLRDWITNANTPLVKGIAAIEALGLIGTEEAFDALIESQVSIEGKVPQVFVEALVDATLSRRNASPLLDRLEDDAERSTIWMACAAALERLAAEASEFVLPSRDRILGLLQRPALRSSEAYPILAAVVGFLDPGPEELARLHKWTMEQESEELSRRAMEAIARAGQGTHWPEQLRALGLTDKGSGWELSRLPSYTEAFTIGLLYNKNHEPFAPALAQMIGRGQSASINQVLPILRANQQGRTHPRVVEDALVARVSKSHRTETLALEALAAIAPQRFISEYSHGVYSQWPAPKRAAVIPCLRYLAHLNTTPQQASEALIRFMQDPVFTIRRAAARAVAEVDVQRLLREATRLSDSKEAEERVFGMEAATWLPDEDAFTRLWETARCDRELSVRRAADHAWRDRRERTQERAYLQRVLEVRADESLCVWHYGQALSEVGDDDTVRVLREALGAKECPPNKRAWLAWLAEAVERAWEKKGRKWEERFT